MSGIKVLSVLQTYQDQIRIRDEYGEIIAVTTGNMMEVEVRMLVPVGTDVTALFERPALKKAVALELDAVRAIRMES